MEDFEKKAQELLDKSKTATLDEAKGLIKSAVEEAQTSVKAVEDQLTEKSKAWEVKFDEMDKEVKEWKSDATKLKLEGEKKTVTFGDALSKAMDENSENIEKFARKEIKEVQFELKAVDMSLASITDLSAANVQMLPGILPVPPRRLHIRSLLPTGQMTTSAIHYLQETGGDGVPAPWTDNSGLKPQLDMQLTEKIAPSEFIAGWLRITRKALDDISAMRSFLQSRLLEKYLVAEDYQLLFGNGASPQLDGLITNAQAYAGFRTIPIEKIVDAAAQVESNNHQATAIVLNPEQYYALMLTKGNTLEYTLPGGSAVNIINGQIYIAGIPVYKTTAMNVQLPTQDSFLVGDFSMGAQLFIRENPIVRFFEEDGTNVRENKITVRVEGRVALPIYYPDAFVTGTLNSSPS